MMNIKKLYPLITLSLVCFFMLGQLPPLHASNDLTLSVSLSSSYATCDVSSDGSVTATTSGGNPPYSYEWSNGGDSWKIEDVPAGFYSVTVTDDDGQTATATEEVELSPEGIWVMLSVEAEVSCAGGDNGVVHAGPMTGVEPYAYEWSDGQTTQDAYGLSAGNICVTVTDANGCSGVECIDVENGDSDLSVSLSSSFATCDASADASVTASVSGGNPPNTYEWSVPNNGPDPWKLEGVGVGTYSVTVTDSDGCSVVASEEVELSPEGIWIMVSLEQEIDCYGGNDGGVHAGAMTGTPPYTYEWSNGETGEDAVNVSAGTICVTVTDANDCAGVECIDVDDPEEMTLEISSTAAACGDDNGSASVEVTGGGTSPYEYDWSNGGTEDEIDDVAAGTYYVTVTDANDCTMVDEVTVGGSNLTVSISSTPELCDSDNGTATADASDGSGDYAYDWGTSTGSVITDLSEGTYTVMVTDNVTGCTGTASIDVGAENETLDVTISSTAALCGTDNGTATADASGGSGDYAYDWGFATGNVITGLSGGTTYTVVVTDNVTGCTGTNSIDIEATDELEVTITSTPELCDNDDGTATADASGGSGDYAYDWGTATGNVITGLSEGAYTVTVTDNVTGCTGTASIDVGAENETLDVIISSTTALCDTDDGTATASASGGSGDYTYDWGFTTGNVITGLSGGTTYTVVVTDNVTGCTGTNNITIQESLDCCDGPTIVNVVIFETPCGIEDGSVTITIAEDPANYSYEWTPAVGSGLAVSNLSGGTYSVVITDLSDPDCSETLTFTIDTDNGPEVNISSIPAICTANNGSATVTPVDPSATYEYLWSTTDTGSNVTNLTAGQYEVTITDPANPDCPGYQTVMIGEENPCVATVEVGNATCGESNGSATVSHNGTGPFTYSWASATNTLSGISSGTYSVIVTDQSNGCSSEVTYTVNDDVDPVEVIIDPIDVMLTCPGDNNGTVVYTVNPPAPVIIVDANGEEQTNGSLSKGNYCIQVINPDNCISGSACFEVIEPAQLDVDINSTDIDCVNSLGTIGLVNITGGIPPYDVVWDPAGADLTALDAGDYSFTLSDANGCSVSEIVPITSDSQAVTVNLEVTDASCSGDNGSISIVEIIGGTAPYDTLWSTGGSEAELADLTPGSYSVTITDANGCIGIGSQMVNDNQPPVITSVVVIETECLTSTGIATISLSENEANYNWTWSGNVSSSNQAIELAAGTYEVTITDPSDTSCEIYEIFTVGTTNGPEAQLVTNPANCTAADGVAFFNPPVYTYEWSDGPVGSGRNNLLAGEYQVTIYDAADPECKDVVTVIIDEENPLELSYNVDNEPDCGVANGTASVSVASGGSGGPYEYAWSNSGSALTGSQSDLSSGIYTVTVTDSVTGCSKDISFVVNDGDGPAAITITTNNIMVSCPGAQDGTVEFTVTPANLIGVITDSNGMIYTNGNLGAGRYCIQVMDDAGCMSGSECFDVIDPDQIDVDVAVYDEACDELGAITLLNIVGGTGDYTIEWAAPVGGGDTLLTNLEANDYSFTLTDANNCIVGTGVTVVDNSVELEVGITLDSTLNCLGDSTATVTAAVSNGTPIYEYDWGTMGSGSSLVDIPSGTYEVTATDANGCTGIDSITINEPPPVFIQLDDDTTACEDVIELVVLTGSTLSITWLDKDGTQVGTGNPLEVAVEDTTCYYVEVVDLNGCPAKDSILVMDGGDIVPDFTWNFDQCGDSAIVSFIDLSTIDIGDIVDWEWIIDGVVYNEENPVVIFEESGNIDVELTVTSSTNCEETMENSFPLLVAPQPPVADSLNLCPGDSMQLYPNFDPNFIYQWSPADYLDDPTSGNPMTSAEEDIVYSVTIMFPDSSCTVVRQVQVQLFDMPETSIMTEDTVLCDLGSVTVNATGTGDTFNWYDMDGNLQGTGNPFTLEVRDPSDPFYLLEMVDANGCIATDSIMVADYSIGLEPFPDASICLHDSTFLEPIVVLNQDLDYDIAWTPNEPIVTDPGVVDVWVNPAETTTFNIEISNEFCSRNEDALVEVIDVSNEISAIADPDTICLSQSTELEVTGGGSYDYEWLSPSSATLDFDNVRNPTATPTETTEYMVKVTQTDGNQCVGTAGVRVVVIDPECGEPFIFFPNAFSPNDDGHNDVLYLRGFNADIVHFVIYNRWGEQVFESNSQDKGWDGTYKGKRLDSDVYGFYLTVLCTNGETYVKKGNVTLLR